jgi:glutamate--cysteine ligase
MRRYLPTVGKNGLDMMRRTATVQANFDYPSEAEAMRALRLGLRLSPFFVAMFANSPFVEGKPYGGKSYRADVWTDVDPHRQGLLPRVLDAKGGFADYIEWVLDAPMFLLLRGDRVVENTGQSFRDFMANGFEGHRATQADWVTHMNSMFPEVRLKRTLEVRGADSLPRDLVVAPAALFTGLYYDDRALAEAEALVAPFTTAELVGLRARVGAEALGARVRDTSVLAVAQRMVEVARGGLERRARRRADGRDESVYLEPLAARLARGRCPADDLVDAFERTGSVAAAVLETVRL